MNKHNGVLPYLAAGLLCAFACLVNVPLNASEVSQYSFVLSSVPAKNGNNDSPTQSNVTPQLPNANPQLPNAVPRLPNATPQLPNATFPASGGNPQMPAFQPPQGVP